MPFESEAQRRFMWAKHPEIAERWAHEYPGQHDLPEHKKNKKKKSEKQSMDQLTKFAENTIEACQVAAAALGKAEQMASEKEAADKAYSDRIASVVEKCAQFGRIDDLPEVREKLAEWLSTPMGALEVIEKLAAMEDEDPSSLGGTRVDTSGRVVGHQKRASLNSVDSPYVGYRSSAKPESWSRFERNLGI